MNALFFIQTVLYFAIAVLGFFVIIPVAVTMNNFDGNCVLYGEIQWLRDSFFKFKPGADSVCEFNIYLHVGIDVLYALFVGAIQVFLIIKENRNERLEVPKVVKIALIVANGICAFLTLVSAGTLSAGLSEWCDQLMEGKNHYLQISTCSDAQEFQWPGSMYGGSFHVCLVLALVSAWILLILWLAQMGMGLLRLLRQLD